MSFKRKAIAAIPACLILAAVSFSGCGTYTKSVRDSYAAIALPATETNGAKFLKSSFNSYFTYKTTLQSDYDMIYFRSYYYYYRSDYGSSEVSIYSTLLIPGDSIITMASTSGNSVGRTDSGTVVTSSHMVDEILLSRAMNMELAFKFKDLKPGFYKGTAANPIVLLSIKDRKGKSLFDVSDNKSFVALEILSVDNGVVSGKFNAKLVGRKREEYLNIKEGEFWFKTR
jgi:hypothetical protein